MRTYSIYFQSKFSKQPEFYQNSFGFWATRRFVKKLNSGDVTYYGWFYPVRVR